LKMGDEWLIEAPGRLGVMPFGPVGKDGPGVGVLLGEVGPPPPPCPAAPRRIASG
jgi:hypothetical protein